MYVKHRFKLKEIHGNTWWNIIIVMIVSAIVVHLYWDMKWKFLAIPIGVPTILGTAISLILAFRTNASYDRWWEARKIWGAIVNDSRTLMRQVIANFNVGENGKNEIRKLGRRQIAWTYALARGLRNQEILPDIKSFLTDKELSQVKNHANIPNAILLLHEQQLKSMHDKSVLDSFQYTYLSDNIHRLTDSMGKCERIKSTVFPTQYSFYIHFTIMTFVMILPFGIMEKLGFFAVPIAGLVAFLFLTIEHFAIDLQRPFDNEPNDTAMNAICRTIEINILQMLEEENIPQPIEPENGVIM